MVPGDGEVHDPVRRCGLLREVKKWKYDPAEKDGVPVAVNCTVSVRFSLKTKKARGPALP